MYEPKPMDTSNIQLSNELMQLVEELAKNVHDVWAKGRIAEGWKYGEEKNSVEKTTPLLVPYNELEENEKEYDRNTAIETLKIILKLGYQISK